MIDDTEIAIGEDSGVPSPALESLAAAAAAALLASCGGGGSENDGGPSGSATTAQASRFLGQAGLAATDEDIQEVQFQRYDGWLNNSFNRTATQSMWDWLVAQGYNTAEYNYSESPCDYAIWHHLITAPDQLRQRIALALSEYFVVSIEGIQSDWPQFIMAAYWDLLCAHAFGNFRELLEAVTLSPAMGLYLSTNGNRKEDSRGRLPDENYAREVMQLFTIGLRELNPDGTPQKDGSGNAIETYNQDTIVNLARVFTGWYIDTSMDPDGTTPYRSPMTLKASNHSTLAATFLGTTIPADTDGVEALRIALDTLFNHHNVGPFFGKQMIQRLVTSNPSPAYVSRVAAAFDNNGGGIRGDMKAVIRAILLDPEARSDDALTLPNSGKLREPMLRFIQWARIFNAKSETFTWRIPDLSDGSRELCQSPLRSPSVFNYFRPGYTPPNSAIADSGMVAPEFQITNEPTVAGYLNFMQSVIQNGTAWNSFTSHNDVTADYATELSLAGDPSALVQRLNLLLAANQIGTATEARIIAAVSTISMTNSSGPLNRVRAAIMLVMACPEYLVQK
ncbi:MAG: DUF1800 domain-containing protein [Gammaproteobacteria bacterium]|nr:DUF1800 domain-containing protein [Gammaproteobacteria bacterium]MBU1414364.1 DUF1800 domain-containing protein [Gammaproteobacteria bacterium]